MKTKDGFQQAYNAQAGVETASRLIVGPRVSQAANDKRELLPDVAAVRCHVLPDALLVDSGFVSEAAVTAVELATPGRTILAALQREPHGRTVAQLGKQSDPPAPPPEAPFAERMRHRTATTAGRALQTPAANRRTGLRHHQRSARIPALLLARSGQSHPRMGVGLPRPQLPAPPPPRRCPPRGLKPPDATAQRPPFAPTLQKSSPSSFSRRHFSTRPRIPKSLSPTNC